MLYQYESKYDGTQVKRAVRYIREHWHEWLWLYVEEGEAYPRFYLPTHRCFMRHATVAWIIPLAPFVLFLVSLHAAFKVFWSDCIQMVDRWRKEVKNRDDLTH